MDANTSVQYSSHSRHAEYIAAPLKDDLLFDDLTSVTEDEISRITSIFDNFLSRVDPQIYKSKFSKKVTENLKEIHDFYKFELCDMHGVKKEEFNDFCNLVDECVKNKFEELKNKKHIQTNYIEKSLDIILQENKIFVEKMKLQLKLEEAQQKIENNLVKKNTFSEKLSHRTMDYKYTLTDTPEEDERRGYTLDWMDVYPFKSEDEVEFVLDNWKTVRQITSLVERFSFPDLMQLEHQDRQFFFEHADDLLYLFKCDNQLTCSLLMQAEKEDRGFLFENIEALEDLFECDGNLPCN